jgi:hypothetical protein
MDIVRPRVRNFGRPMRRLVAIAVLSAAVCGVVLLSAFAGSALTTHAVGVSDATAAATGEARDASLPAGRRTLCAVASDSDRLAQGTPTPTKIPTVVTAVAFRAVRSKKAVVVRWTTRSEVGVAGFNLYCGSSTERVKRNKKVIRAKGLASAPTSGHSYSFRDPVKLGSKPALYWLEIVDPHGRSTFYGPYAVR